MAENTNGNWAGAIRYMPKNRTVAEELPVKARNYLQQALDSVGVAPDGAVILTASAVDAMLKEQGYSDGSLYKRIDEAASNHLITDSMKDWAHEVRLEANDQRHADETVGHKTKEDADRCVEFATALGEYLYVMPSKVQRGRQTSNP